MRFFVRDGTSRITAWFVPPISCDYSFFAKTSGVAELWWSGGESTILNGTLISGVTTDDWQPQPQSTPVALVKGSYYWMELLCYDAGDIGECALGVRVHAPRLTIPSGTHGASGSIQRLTILESDRGIELVAPGCAHHGLVPWPVREDQLQAELNALYTSMPTDSTPSGLGVRVTSIGVTESEDHPGWGSHNFQIEFLDPGAMPLLRARAYGVEWAATHVLQGGVDMMPIPGRMLVAPSSKSGVSVRVGGRTTALCDTIDWSKQLTGCWLRYHQVGFRLLPLVHPAYAMGMTLERCNTHCNRWRMPFFVVSQDAGVTVECVLSASHASHKTPPRFVDC